MRAPLVWLLFAATFPSAALAVHPEEGFLRARFEDRAILRRALARYEQLSSPAEAAARLAFSSEDQTFLRQQADREKLKALSLLALNGPRLTLQTTPPVDLKVDPTTPGYVSVNGKAVLLHPLKPTDEQVSSIRTALEAPASKGKEKAPPPSALAVYYAATAVVGAACYYSLGKHSGAVDLGQGGLSAVPAGPLSDACLAYSLAWPVSFVSEKKKEEESSKTRADFLLTDLSCPFGRTGTVTARFSAVQGTETRSFTWSLPFGEKTKLSGGASDDAAATTNLLRRLAEYYSTICEDQPKGVAKRARAAIGENFARRAERGAAPAN